MKRDEILHLLSRRLWLSVLEHCQVKWIGFAVENAADTKTRAESMAMETAWEHCQVKWVRFTVENAAQSKSGADSVRTGTVPGFKEIGSTGS